MLTHDQIELLTVTADIIMVGVLSLIWIIVGGIIVPSYLCKRYNVTHVDEILIVVTLWTFFLGCTVIGSGRLIAYHHFV